MRHLHFDDLGAHRPEDAQTLLQGAADFVVDAFVKVVDRYADPYPAYTARKHTLVIFDRHRAAGRILRIVSSDGRKDPGAVADRAGQGADLIEGEGEGHDTVAAYPPLRRLQARQAADARGQPDGATGVGAERTMHHARGDCRRRSARRAAGYVVRVPRIATVPPMRVVPGGPECEFGPVEGGSKERGGG